MTKKPTLSRPAASAIAAFLALSTPAALAQTAPVAEPAPPTVMAPPVAPTTTSPVAAPAPVIRVPLDLPAEPVATPAPRPAAKAVARPAPKAAPRAAAAERTAPAAPAPVEAAPVAATAAAASALPAAEVAPVAPVVDPAPTAVTTEAAAPSDGFPWEIAVGAAALLLAGGVGLTFARRRRRAVAAADAWEFREAGAETEWVPAAAPVVAREAEPMVNPEPIPAPAPVEEPVRRTTPSFAAAPSGSMGRHEAMALVGPTADNPFATLSKRLKRARFLDRKERVAYEATLVGEQPVASEPARKPVSAWEIAQRPAPAVPAQQDVRRPEPVQRGLSHGFRRPDFAGK
jgi:hypothetical protein